MSTIRPDCTFCKLNQLNIKAYTMLMISLASKEERSILV